MKIQVFQGTDLQQFQTLQQEGKIFTIQPITHDGRNLITSLRNMRVPLQPLAQVVDDEGKVHGLSFATGNGIALSELGAGYVVSFNGQEIMTLKQSTEDGIGVAELAAQSSPGYPPTISYPVEQAPPPYQQQPYPQQSYAPPQPYQQQPYPQQPYAQGQPYPPPYGYQSGYDPTGFAAPMYPMPVPYVDYHANPHLLHHYYDHGYGHGWGHGGYGDHDDDHH
jgi:hypothetical protein